MEKVFVEKDGDRGANRILTKQRNNMHALWDQLLGDDFELNGVRKRIVEITSDAELVEQASKISSAPDWLDPQAWLTESRMEATKNVYTIEVLESLNLVSRGLLDKPEKLDLSENYLKNAVLGTVPGDRGCLSPKRNVEGITQVKNDIYPFFGSPQRATLENTLTTIRSVRLANVKTRMKRGVGRFQVPSA